MGQRCEFKDLDGSYLRKYHSLGSSTTVTDDGIRSLSIM